MRTNAESARNLADVALSVGRHFDAQSGTCLLEAVSLFAGEQFSDRPQCVSPVLGDFGRFLNDMLPKDKRQTLIPLIPLMVGTVEDERDERRSWIVLDWMVRVWTPAFVGLILPAHADKLRSLEEVTDLQTLKGAKSVVRNAEVSAWKTASARSAPYGHPGLAALHASGFWTIEEIASGFWTIEGIKAFQATRQSCRRAAMFSASSVTDHQLLERTVAELHDDAIRLLSDQLIAAL